MANCRVCKFCFPDHGLVNYDGKRLRAKTSEDTSLMCWDCMLGKEKFLTKTEKEEAILAFIKCLSKSEIDRLKNHLKAKKPVLIGTYYSKSFVYFNNVPSLEAVVSESQFSEDTPMSELNLPERIKELFTIQIENLQQAVVELTQPELLHCLETRKTRKTHTFAETLEIS